MNLLMAADLKQGRAGASRATLGRDLSCSAARAGRDRSNGGTGGARASFQRGDVVGLDPARCRTDSRRSAGDSCNGNRAEPSRASWVCPNVRHCLNNYRLRMSGSLLRKCNNTDKSSVADGDPSVPCIRLLGVKVRNARYGAGGRSRTGKRPSCLTASGESIPAGHPRSDAVPDVRTRRRGAPASFGRGYSVMRTVRA